MATPAATTDYPHEVQELQDALRERDQVVQMLTQRLEQAADQLDRWQRSGTERRGTSASANTSDAPEGQHVLLEQMTRVLGEWEELQAGQMLARIESQVLELKELISSRDVFVPSNGTSGNCAVGPLSASSQSRSAPAAAENPGWEAIKASMMSGDSGSESSRSTTAESALVQQSVEKPETAAVPKSSEPLPPLPAPPRIIDVAKAPVEALREAVESRDDFILALLRRVAAQDQQAPLPDWDKLNQAPAELRRSLEDLQQRLQETLRVTEVDLSMQRAKLGREGMKLQVKAEQVTRHQRQLGLPTEDTDAGSNGGKPHADGAQNVQGRRWLQFLQRSAPGTPDADDKSR